MRVNAFNPSPMQFLADSVLQVRNNMARVFSALNSIQNDGNATIYLLKVCRHAISIFRAYYGKPSGASIAHRDLDTTINTLEGLQFIGVINTLLPVKNDGNEAEEQNKASLLDRIDSVLEKVTNAGFMTSDCFSGAAWLLSKGVPLFGVFSQTEKVATCVEVASLGSALIASIADGSSATKSIVNYWKVSVPEKTSAIWKLAERVTGAISFILILGGATGTLASIATGLATASALCGLIRFVYNLDLPKGINQT